jgi:hypothetical protein
LEKREGKRRETKRRPINNIFAFLLNSTHIEHRETMIWRKFEIQILSLQSFFGALTASNKSLVV